MLSGEKAEEVNLRRVVRGWLSEEVTTFMLTPKGFKGTGW